MLLNIHAHHRSSAEVSDESILNIDLSSPFVISSAQNLSLIGSLKYSLNEVKNLIRQGEGYYSLGIHPWTASQATLETWAYLEEAAHQQNVSAIGEAGLDKLTDTDWDIQQEAFIHQIRLSETVGKPLIIHCVKAFNEVIRLKKEMKPQQPWIVHGFRNNLNIARQLMNEGIYLSLGEKYQEEVLMNIPLHRLLVETDESTLPIRDIIARMADVRGMEADELIKILTENVQNIFFRP